MFILLLLLLLFVSFDVSLELNIPKGLYPADIEIFLFEVAVKGVLGGDERVLVLFSEEWVVVDDVGNVFELIVCKGDFEFKGILVC